MELVVVVIWLLMGLWTGNVAKNKGRKFTPWMWAGIIFGIFAVIRVYAVDEK